MSDRWRVLAGAALMLGLVACGRMPAVDSATPPQAARAGDVELAGGPPPDAPPLDGASSAPASQEPVELAGGPPPSDGPAAAAQPADPDIRPQASPPPSSAPTLVALDGGPEPASRPSPAASVAAAEPVKVQDPLEPVNRKLFQVDSAISKMGQRLPMRRIAAECSPKPLRAGLANVVANLQEPTTFANQILQRKIARAATTAVRFVINSTVGLFGLFQPAHKVGLARVKTNFGQTLAAYGVGAGPYLYMPVVGPMTLRDMAGVAADGYLSPFAWLRLTDVERRAVQAASLAARPANSSVRAAARQANPIVAAHDEYAAVRQMHYQQEAADAATASGKPLPRPLQMASRDPR